MYKKAQVRLVMLYSRMGMLLYRDTALLTSSAELPAGRSSWQS